MSKHSHVIIVGSGPIGATYAREILENNPSATVTMLELGPLLTKRPGESVKNIIDDDARAVARAMSQGPQSDEATRAKLGLPYLQEGTLTARQGTHLIDFGGTGSGHAGSFPMAAVSTNVGGQGAHWTCAVPRPADSEKISFIPEAEWEIAITRAEELIGASPEPFQKSKVGGAILSVLKEEFKDDFHSGVTPIRLPLSGREQPNGTMIWGGTDFVFGPLTDPSTEISKRFTLRPLTMARRILVENEKATGVLIEDSVTGEQQELFADAVVVAADAIRTPQLLWASGIRPKALGHYLTEHPVIFSCIALDDEKMSRFAKDSDLADERALAALSPGDPVSAVTRVPFQEPQHPFSAQIMYVTRTPFPLPEGDPFKDNKWGYAMAGWGLRKFPRFEDAVTFDDNELDYRGFPNVTIQYELTDRELAEAEEAKKFQARAAEALGQFVPGPGMPKLMAPGTSLHYMGTHRIGPTNDGTSVCNSYSQVWDIDGLYTGGNGTLPTANSVNPTVSSMAVAVRGARKLAASLGN
jgi:pyranose oxidase